MSLSQLESETTQRFIKQLLAALVSLRIFVLRVYQTPFTKSYPTLIMNLPPQLEYFAVIDHDPKAHCWKQHCGTWVVCDEGELPSDMRTLAMTTSIPILRS
jgi:hypothetical protein